MTNQSCQSEAQIEEYEEIDLRTTKSDRELMIRLIHALAEEFIQTRFAEVARHTEGGIVHRELSRYTEGQVSTLRSFVGHVAVKWEVKNPFVTTDAPLSDQSSDEEADKRP